MALTMRTLTGSLLDVQGVPRGANVQQAWIGSSKATIVDAPSTVRVGLIVPLALSGAGAFSVSLPDSAEAGVLDPRGPQATAARPARPSSGRST